QWQSRDWCQSRIPRVAQFIEGVVLALCYAPDRFHQRVGGFVVERSVEIAQNFKSVLMWRFRSEARNHLLIAHQKDVFLLAFDVIHHGAKIPCDISDS